jgi:hypothetical protein
MLPCRSELALEMDTAAFDVPGKGNVQSTIQQIKEYMGICRDMQMYGERDTQREHFADRMVWEYLQSKGQDPAFYQTFTGNQMQHLLWDWNLQALQKGCELYPETLPMSLQNVIEFGLEANLAVKNSIVAKDYMQATGIVTTLNSLFTHIDTVLKLGDDTLKGISDGIVQAVENTCHTIEHIDELPGNFLDVSTKAFKLLVLIEKTNDKLIAGVDREEAFKEFNQKVTPVINAMVDIAQQASWKDFVRETTAFCVGCKIDSKIFHLVGEAATFAARTESLTKNVFEALAELTAPEAVAVTAERITVNAGKAAEQCALSETKEVAKQGAKVSEALAESAESKIPLSPKITLENEALLKNFNPSHYDPAIICPKLLASAKELFVNIPGAMGDNGPLRQILKRGKIGLNADSSLKGAVYELEKALELESKGEKVIEFGKKIGGREFDIITKTKALECKNISWERFQVGESLVTEKQIKDLINKTQSTFSQQKQFAEEFGLKFEIHSKNKIPENWKIWFSEKNINFFEG